MRAAIVGAAWLACVPGCKSSSDLPIQPGGGETGPGAHGSGAPDATPLDAAAHDAAVAPVFRACLVTDLRSGAPCATTGAGGLTVTLGTATATTAADGSFALVPPTATGLTWQVSGTGMVTSIQQFSPLATIPIISTTSYADLVADQGAVVLDQQGSVVVAVTHAGALEAGVEATTTPFTTPYYDLAASPFFSSGTGETDAHGTVWVIGVPVGSLAITLTPLATTTTPVTVSDLPVVDQAITFAVVTMP